MSTGRRLWATAALLVWSQYGWSQTDACFAGRYRDDDLSTCWQRVYDAAVAEIPENLADAARQKTPMGQLNAAANAAAGEVQTRLLSEPIGTAVGVAQTATHNLLPNFGIAGLGVGKGDASQALRSDLNFRLPGAKANNGQLRLGAIPKPELAQPVVDALAGAAAGQVEALKGKLGPDDDYSGELTWTLRGHGFGRDLDLYKDRLSDLLADAYPGMPDVADWTTQFTINCVSPPAKDVTRKPMSAIKKDPSFVANKKQCEDLLDRYQEVARQQVDWLKSFAVNRRQAHLDRFADLVSNQPQLTVSLIRTQRAPVVGASFTAVRVGFEVGWVDLNDFEDQASAQCLPMKAASAAGEGREPPPVGCLASFRRFVEKNDASLSAHDRITAWVEYARLQNVHVSLPEAGVDLKIDGGSRIAAGVGAGYTLLAEQDGRSTRIDGAARYERFVADAARLDHATYSVVLTQRLGLVSVPFVLAYSDRNEFRGGPKGLTTTLGLGYDFGLPGPTTLPELKVSTLPRVVDLGN